MKQKWVPRNYQFEAVKLLISMGCGGLLLDPGLGKTVVSLKAFQILKQKGLAKRLLVIAPLRPMVSVWPGEIEKWEDFKDLTYAVIHGDDKLAMMEAEADVFLLNPEAIEWFFNNGGIRKVRPDILCVDESTKFKNSTTKRFKALRPQLNHFRRRWILTGSPTPNGMMDLFGQIYILDQGNALGRFITHYRMTYFYPAGFGGYEWRLQPGAADRIAAKVDPMVLRLKAEDWLDMPELINTNIMVELPPAARRTYQQIEDAFITEINDEVITAANAAVAGGKCRQVANGALYSEEVLQATSERQFHKVHDAKLEALKALIEELQGQPLLILYEFDHDRRVIQEAFSDMPAIGGHTSAAKSVEFINAFNSGLLPYLAGHPASMGHGLNLQGACFRVCWYGITWNLEHYQQAIARVYRQGQQSAHVMVYHIVAKDTLDETVLEVLQQKDARQESLLSRFRALAERI